MSSSAGLTQLALSRASVDRAAHHRTDQAWLDARWADPATRVLVLEHGQARVVHDGAAPTLLLVAPDQAPDGLQILLGVDADDVACFAVVTDPGRNPDLGEANGTRWVGLREVGALLTDTEAGLFVHAAAMANWHETHSHCPRCGAPTEPVLSGSVRRCPADGSEHYPRTDPAVIMTVVDDDDRLLLGHQARWPNGRFSTLAGFVEPGESLEAAVRREVLEEVGLHVGVVTYMGSQPWPFPSSLMLGFHAHAIDCEAHPDGHEISDARWFTRPELAAAVAARDVLLPSPVSIARRLVENWYGGPVGEDLAW
ncbi:MAG TPA: NAD(+) diphosphatase [Actinomycetes bacterium]|nr:NAD(+) diphosphatase [Actinomycetes bacterium]